MNLCSDWEELDESTCHCRCKNVEQCLSPRTFNYFSCQCELPSNTKCYEGGALKSCPPLKVLNAETCTCVCPSEQKILCSNLETFNENTCSCQCKNTEKCLPPYAFNYVTCQCELLPPIGKCHNEENGCPSPKVFDAESCTCVCPSGLKNMCSYLEKFDESICSCQCKNTAKCIQPKTFDYVTCQCEQSPIIECDEKSASKSCPKSFFWDPLKCDCRCGLSSCPDGHELDPKSCTCVCARICEPGYKLTRCQCVPDADCELTKSPYDCQAINCSVNGKSCT